MPTALSKELDPGKVLRAVVEAVAEAYGYTLVSTYLLEGQGERQELVLQHQVGYCSVLRRIPMGCGVMARTVHAGEPVLLENTHADPDFLDAMQGIVSEVCVPLFDERKMIGALNVESTGGVALTEEDLRLMVAFGEHVDIALGRARLHERVRASEERHRSVVENVKEVIFQTDPEGLCTFLNPAWEEVTGFLVEESLGENFLGDYRQFAKDGSVVCIRDEAVLVREDEGEPLYWLGIKSDLTKRKEAERRLGEAEARYRTLVEQTPVATYVQEIEHNNATVYMSPQIEDILGYSSREYTEDSRRLGAPPAEMRRAHRNTPGPPSGRSSQNAPAASGPAKDGKPGPGCR